MNNICTYAKNETKSTTLERAKRRLCSDELQSNTRKKRALSIHGRQYDVSVNENFSSVEHKPSTSDSVEPKNTHCENDSQNQVIDIDCINEETFVNKVDGFFKTVDFTPIANLCSNGNFSQLQPSTTQTVSILSSQAYVGLIEKDKLMLLLDFLLKLHNSETAFPKFQEKCKVWAITQLKKSFCLPPSVLFEKEYFQPVTLQTAITKVIGVIASRKPAEKNIPHEIIHILSNVSLVALKMAILPHPLLTESILKILYENKSTLSISQELLEHINILLIEDKINVNSESLAYLWCLHPSSLEDIIVDLLTENKTESSRRKITLKLVEACHHNSVLFQKVINMFITAWLLTRGCSRIADSLSKFMCLVQNACSNYSLLSLFPSELSPLLLLIQMPAEDFPTDMQRLHAYSVVEMFSDMVLSGLCQIKDVIILFLMFPSWYQILYSLSTTEPFSSNTTLKMLVNASSEMQATSMADYNS